VWVKTNYLNMHPGDAGRQKKGVDGERARNERVVMSWDFLGGGVPGGFKEKKTCAKKEKVKEMFSGERNGYASVFWIRNAAGSSAAKKQLARWKVASGCKGGRGETQPALNSE